MSITAEKPRNIKKNVNPETGRKDVKVGKVSKKPAELFKNTEIRSASMQEVAQHLADRLALMGDNNIVDDRRAWLLTAKELNLDLKNNVYRYDRKTNTVYFIETMAEKRKRETQNHPLARLLAGR